MHCLTSARGLGLCHANPGPAVLLTELLKPDRVVLPLAARDKSAAIAELTRYLVDCSGGAYADVLGAVEEREAVLSTGIGFGVAIPHARSPAVKELTLVCGVSPVPVPYDSIDGEPVRLFFLIVGPESSAGQHVKILSRIARLVRRENVREKLCEARTPSEFYKVLLDAEASG
jgi:mannitol/fructose-specific phosphotransferase system IIA component (Ntr-type)